MIHENAKWIWLSSRFEPDEYVVFEEEFTWAEGTAVFSLAAETDYLLFVNGVRAGFGQFAGYPFRKYCDELDITALCKPGKNILTLTVRYEGRNSATHIDDGAGVIYSLDMGGSCVLYSSAQTRAGFDNRYIQHMARILTGQLGYTSGMRCGGYRCDTPCVELEKCMDIRPRPVKKTVEQPYVEAVPVPGKPNIYDLGREEAGYLCLRVRADRPCTLQIAYGEHLVDGCVRHKIGTRDFTLDFEVTEGTHEFQQFFLRVAGRYLQALVPEGVEILSIGLIPALYPLTRKPFLPENPLDRQIYETCVRTLRLCMNLHYEDCPWREQALYVLDSRNQMLCGYHAFEETEFPREMLKFMALGTRPEGYLELTFPAVETPSIPFFSMMYPVNVYEYIAHTGDQSILEEVFPVMLKIMENFRARIQENGLIRSLDNPYWNFYEWSEGHTDNIPGPNDTEVCNYYHLVLNCGYVYAASRFETLCRMVGQEFRSGAEGVKQAIRATFFRPESGLFSLRTDRMELSSQLGNAFALLIGLGDERTAEAVKRIGDTVPATLSMMTFVYDALLAYDEGNRDYVLADIREKYGHMLAQGATSFWETILGEADFANAGSLCHGWSAVPIHYYNLFRH